MADARAASPKPPPSVVAYGPAHVIWNLLFVLTREEGLDGGAFIALLIPLAVAFGIWKRSKAVWAVGIFLDGVVILLGIGHIVTNDPTLGAMQVGGALVMLGLLLAPSTRRWVT